MIIIEFLVFVISSGVFCSEKFRHNLWAVIVAGVVATGSSLLFAYDLGHKMMGHPKEPPVVTKFITQTIVKPGQTSDPATVGKAHSCAAAYPKDSVHNGEEGVTKLAFTVLSDGTVSDIKVAGSSGFARLDEAAVQCVADWHYRPAMKDGQIVDKPWRAKVTWKLATAAELRAQEKAQQANPDAVPVPPNDTKTEEKSDIAAGTTESKRHWYNPLSWFSSESSEDTKKDAEKPEAEKKPETP